jgi:hypothetical protein
MIAFKDGPNLRLISRRADLFEGVFARAGLVTDVELLRAPHRITGWRRRASTDGHAATGSCFRGFSEAESRSSGAGRCSTTSVARCRRRRPNLPVDRSAEVGGTFFA